MAIPSDTDWEEDVEALKPVKTQLRSLFIPTDFESLKFLAFHSTTPDEIMRPLSGNSRAQQEIGITNTTIQQYLQMTFYTTQTALSSILYE
ncbi:hypothetical protein DAPPUDRAFT_327866 [Daphnia pulex]|uniref:Uncharacterized protein n=1 Tax=Daphnia pulex TaxID=6669 RepID=E9HC06_DAPPU|nr:hypothetical protein DAPPUDRAFT_327866 [Daphnia pulex]|eukprot:EFX70744.1 hypothetical protein DAPPUDRAFT_327866 [Daphnia pulex]